MSVLVRLKDYLDEHSVKYIAMTHSTAFTAQEIAATMHVPGKELAKTVIVKAGEDEFFMVVLPASRKINFDLLEKVTETEGLRLASEEEFMDMFPDCEIGAMPPFGNLYNMKEYVASTLAEDEEIFFNAGTHTDLIRMAYRDYERLIHPDVATFTDPIN